MRKVGEWGEVEIRANNNDGNYHRQNATAAVGSAVIKKGTVVAKYTSGPNTGLIAAWTPGASDGTETAVGILVATTDPTVEEMECGYYTQGGFIESRLTFPSGQTGWRTQLGAKRDPAMDYVAIYN